MRLLSVRLIVSLIVGITLVSSGFSYYEVLGEKRTLRSDLERRAEMLGESLVGNVESRGIQRTRNVRTVPNDDCSDWCSASETGST